MDFKEHLEKYLSTEIINDLTISLSQKRTNCLLLNTDKISEENFLKKYPNISKHPIIKNAYFYDKNVYDFGKHFLFDNGAYYIMDSASMLVSHFLSIENDDYVLDMCAAPGGKTISCALKNRNANYIANDQSYQRALILSSNIEKIGLDNVIVTSSTINILERYYKNTFNKIILDAPCSGSAMFRKDEDMKNDWTYQKVLSCQKIQNELLESAAKMLKKDGIISYSTCSFSYEEDEEVIINFLSIHNEFETVKIEDNETFYRGKNLKDSIHLLPCFYKGEGQFICLLKKIKDTEEIGSKLSKNQPDKTKFNYGYKHYDKINDSLYGYNNDLDLSHLAILRKGLHILTYKGKIEIPSFQYAHCQNSSKSIVLDEIEAKKYIHGDEIKKVTNLSTGYYVVSYNSINLGYVHIVGDKLKNLYPKGLRH